MGRPPRELYCKFNEVQIVARLEANFSDFVLLKVMILAQADRPLVGGFEANAAIGAAADMSAFDREVAAARHRTAMTSHPGAMRCTGA